MAPTANESELQNAATPASPANGSQPKVQPVALEIAVTVNGARTVEGSDKREPFSETTQTVLVFGSGAVIRLNSSVAPGQLLFLTNEKTKKEVVCQVVKSKNYRSVSGYVELEFTEPAVGFWGMRFPTDRIASAPAASNVAPITVAPPKSAPATASSELSAPVVAPPALVPPVPVNVAPQVVEKVVAPPAADASGELRKETARLQEQLSSMLFAETPAPKPAGNEPPADAAKLRETTAKVLELAAPAEPAVAPAKSFEPLQLTPLPPKQKPASSLHDEEVKIPSWLEPLARNAASPSPASSVPASTPAPVAAPPAQPSLVALTDVASDSPAHEVAGESYDFGARSDSASAPAADVNVPNFGSDLFQSSDSASAEPTSGGSKKGLWVGAIAATVLLAAGGGWWYTQQSGGAASASSPAPISHAVDSSATTNPETDQKYLASTSVPQAGKAFSTPSPVTSQPSASEKVSVSPAVEVQKVPNTRERETTKSAASASSTAGKAAEPVEDTRKTSFSQLRLAAPNVKGGNAVAPAEGDPGIALENGAAAGSLSSSLGGHGNVPTAPIPVGGEVKSAQLLSSTQPSYPPLARSQRVSGDVKIDALIDENGRVTGMKVVTGPVLLHQAAMDSLRQWKYRPASLDGKPVSMHLLVTIQFRLQ